MSLFEHLGLGAWETLSLAALGGLASLVLLLWRARRDPARAFVTASILAACCVAALAFLESDQPRLTAFASGCLLASMIMIAMLWQKPKEKNACLRDMRKMAGWANDKGDAVPDERDPASKE